MGLIKKAVATSLLLLAAEEVFSYDKDVHYYVTAMILSDLEKNGKPLSSSKLLAALSNQYVDDNDNTLPTMNPFNPQQRRNWHFPAEMTEGLIKNDYGTVKRNSVFAKHNVNRGLQDNNPTLLGMALHTYLDSYAHESYSAYFGHAAAGHDPDRPHLDPDKFKEAVQMLYKILSQWYANNGVKVDPNTIDLNKYYEWAKYVPPSYSCITCSYETGEINERSNYWHTQITTNFPYLKLPTYYFMVGADKNNFEGVAKGFLTPYSADTAIGIEWYSKKFDNILASKAALTKLAQNDSGSDRYSQFIGLTKTQAANLAIDNPDLIKDGLPPILDNRSGVIALFKAASKSKIGWQTLYMAASSSHNNGVSWAKFTKEITPLLSSTVVEKKLFAIGALSVADTKASRACNSINRYYQKVNLADMDDVQRDFLLNTIRSNPKNIAECSSESLAVLQKFLDDDVFGGMAAARLYKISADENEYQRAVSGNLNTADIILKVRENAKSLLKTKYTKIAAQPALAPKSFNNSRAFVTSLSDIDYWSSRVNEDFDDDDKNSQSDREALGLLQQRLLEALNRVDLNLVSGIASTIATYDVDDQPSGRLIDLLKQYLGDPRFASVRDELEYALNNLMRNS